MATIAIGRLTEFDPNSDSITAYVERVKLFFHANEIAEGKQVAVFLSAMGPKTYSLLRSLVTPESPKDKTLEQLVEVLTKHFEPKPLVIAERFNFHRRSQRTGESAKNFAAELRRLTIHCEFGDHLNEALRDRFVCGLNNETIQKRLLTEKELTFVGAIEIAHGMESAADNARKLQASSQEPKDIHKLTPPRGEIKPCYRCGQHDHKPAQCPYKSSKCHHCGKQGHLKRMCHKRQQQSPTNESKRRPPGQSVRQVKDIQELESLGLYAINDKSVKPFTVDLKLNGKLLCMELDTGATVSLVSEKTFHQLFPSTTLQPSSTQLHSYSGESITVVGQVEVEVNYGTQTVKLPLIVVSGDGPSLFGRDWMTKIQLNWKEIYTVTMEAKLNDLLDRHSTLFQPGLGTLKDYKAKIYVDPQAKPKFCKARQVPYSMKSKVEEELERLEKEGIIEPVQYAEWAAPIVPVLKADGKSLRICGDFKVTVNKASQLDRYPIPKIEDLFATLAHGKTFTKLDMSQAYQQLLLDEDSRNYVVVNTHRGLFRYNRLPFGIASAPAIFQRVMECLLKGIPGVIVYLDDILITGSSTEEHLATLDKVFQKLQDAGLKLKRNKCVFLAPSVTYLGHRIDAQGLHPVEEKVKAVQGVPTPKNVTELKSYLGMLSYYSKFLPNLSTELAPLHKLLKHSTPWQWKTEQQDAFDNSKKLLTSSQLLVHFDPELEIILACDASDYGIGAVLSHRMTDGSEMPIGFVSRTLTKAEKNYSQLEKEGLACIYGVKRFHSYLFGHKFTLQTDHQPLTTLFDESKVVPAQASSRIQRWALSLASYQYTISFRSTTKHGNADAMSRLPLPNQPSNTPVPSELVLLIENLNEAPITSDQIAGWTQKDPILSRVMQHIMLGWPATVESEFKPYWNRRLELSTHAGCILWGLRVPQGRSAVLAELHGAHPGITRMKALARQWVWWPNLDQAIEDVVKHCEECQQDRPNPPPAPLHPWQWPTHPWTRLHIDFAGPMDGVMFLVVIDSHSKWIEVFPMKSATSAATVRYLRQLIAQFGIPETIVSDNGTQFVATEFKEFCQQNGIRHIQTAPYHPSSNRLAERAVQVFKHGVRKQSSGSIHDKIARVLFQYRTTPHSTTGITPAELLLGRKLRSRLDLLKPNIGQKVAAKQQQQKNFHDTHCRERTFSVGERVFIKNNAKGQKWIPGSITKQTGPVSFKVKLHNGKIIRCHQDQLRKREIDDSALTQQSPLLTDDDLTMFTGNGITPQVVTEQTHVNTERRYPSRQRRPPARYREPVT